MAEAVDDGDQQHRERGEQHAVGTSGAGDLAGRLADQHAHPGHGAPADQEEQHGSQEEEAIAQDVRQDPAAHPGVIVVVGIGNGELAAVAGHARSCSPGGAAL